MWKDFKKFIARGNLMDLAVGIMVGAAFNSLVQSFVKDILTPIISVFLGQHNMSQWMVRWELPGLLATGEKKFVEITYGKFLQTGFDFLIMAFVVFIIVRFMSKLKEMSEDTNNKEIPTPKDIALLTEIRDALLEKRK